MLYPNLWPKIVEKSDVQVSDLNKKLESYSEWHTSVERFSTSTRAYSTVEWEARYLQYVNGLHDFDNLRAGCTYRLVRDKNCLFAWGKVLHPNQRKPVRDQIMVIKLLKKRTGSPLAGAFEGPVQTKYFRYDYVTSDSVENHAEEARLGFDYLTSKAAQKDAEGAQPGWSWIPNLRWYDRTVKLQVDGGRRFQLTLTNANDGSFVTLDSIGGRGKI